MHDKTLWDTKKKKHFPDNDLIMKPLKRHY